MKDFLTLFLTQLAIASPQLLVCFVGLILAVMFWSRSPLACMLTVVALLLMSLSLAGVPLLNNYFITQARSGSMSMEQRGWVLSSINTVASLLRAVALGLLLWAVFSGRSRANATPAQR